MTEIQAWLLIFGCGALVFLTRSIFILPGSNLQLSPAVQRMLRYAPAAALAAIIAPDLGMSHGALALSPDNARLIAGLAAVAIAAATRSILLTIAGGMLLLTLLRFAFGTLA